MRKILFKTNYLFSLVVIALFCSLSIQAKDKEVSKDIKVEIKEYINHHLKDSYDFSLFRTLIIQESMFILEYLYQ